MGGINSNTNTESASNEQLDLKSEKKNNTTRSRNRPGSDGKIALTTCGFSLNIEDWNDVHDTDIEIRDDDPTWDGSTWNCHRKVVAESGREHCIFHQNAPEVDGIEGKQKARIAEHVSEDAIEFPADVDPSQVFLDLVNGKSDSDGWTGNTQELPDEIWQVDEEKTNSADEYKRRRKQFIGSVLGDIDLTYESLNADDMYPIDLRCARLGRINWENARVSHDLSMQGSRVDTASLTDMDMSGDVSLNNADVSGDVSLNNADVDGDISLNNADVDGGISLNNANVDGGISLNNANVDGDVWLLKTNVDGDVSVKYAGLDRLVSLNNADVSGDVSLKDADVEKYVSLKDADVDGTVSLMRANVDEYVSLNNADLGRYVSLLRANINGRVSLMRANVNGTVSLERADVDGTVSLERADVDGTVSLERADVYENFSRETVSLDHADVDENLLLVDADVDGDISLEDVGVENMSRS